MVFYWKLKHSYKTHASLHPGPNARIFRISPLRVTYEVRKYPAIFIVVVLKIQMHGLWFVYKTKLTFKRHLEISKIYSSFMFTL